MLHNLDLHYNFYDKACKLVYFHEVIYISLFNFTSQTFQLSQHAKYKDLINFQFSIVVATSVSTKLPINMCINWGKNKIITWNRDHKKENKQDPTCCYQMLTKPKKQRSNKPTRFTTLGMLKPLAIVTLYLQVIHV